MVKGTSTRVLVGGDTIYRALTKSSPSHWGNIGSLDPRSLHLEIIPKGGDPRRHRMCFGV